MTIGHLILRYLHISMAMLGLFSGAAAMIFRKGSPLHRKSGNVFFVSMLLMSAAGVCMSIFITPVMANVMGGSFTFYLVATGWATVIRKPGQIGRFEIAAALGGLAIAVAGVSFGLHAASSPGGKLHGSGAAFYYVFGGLALFATTLDARMIARGGLTGAARTTRHLWRMGFAFFNATASFFFGQAKLFPAGVRESGVLRIPVLLAVGAVLYWLIRIRVWPSIRRVRALRVAHPFQIADRIEELP